MKPKLKVGDAACWLHRLQLLHLRRPDFWLSPPSLLPCSLFLPIFLPVLLVLEILNWTVSILTTTSQISTRYYPPTVTPSFSMAQWSNHHEHSSSCCKEATCILESLIFAASRLAISPAIPKPTTVSFTFLGSLAAQPSDHVKQVREISQRGHQDQSQLLTRFWIFFWLRILTSFLWLAGSPQIEICRAYSGSNPYRGGRCRRDISDITSSVTWFNMDGSLQGTHSCAFHGAGGSTRCDVTISGREPEDARD